MKKLFALANICLIYFTSCVPTYYAPNTHNLTMFSGPKQFQGRAAIQLSNRIEIQTAYSATHTIGLQLNTAFYKQDSGNEIVSGRMGEIGIGYYKAFGKNVFFENYGLMALGTVNNTFIEPELYDIGIYNSGHLNAKLFRLSTQSSIGFRNKYVGAAFSLRVSHVRFRDINGNLVYEDLDQIEYLNTNRHHFFYEPRLTLWLGYRPVKAFLQYGGSYGFKQDIFKLRHTQQYNFSLGLQFAIYKDKN